MTYKEYWAYQEVTKNWESDIVISEDGKNATVTIWYDKSENDIYAVFRIEYFEGDWYVLDETDGKHTMFEPDYVDTLDDCICGCFYYFHTRY